MSVPGRLFIRGAGTFEVVGGTGRFRGATGAGTFAVAAEVTAFQPAGVAGTFRLRFDGQSHRPNNSSAPGLRGAAGRAGRAGGGGGSRRAARAASSPRSAGTAAYVVVDRRRVEPEPQRDRRFSLSPSSRQSSTSRTGRQAGHVRLRCQPERPAVVSGQLLLHPVDHPPGDPRGNGRSPGERVSANRTSLARRRDRRCGRRAPRPSRPGRSVSLTNSRPSHSPVGDVSCRTRATGRPRAGRRTGPGPGCFEIAPRVRSRSHPIQLSSRTRSDPQCPSISVVGPRTVGFRWPGRVLMMPSPAPVSRRSPVTRCRCQAVGSSPRSRTRPPVGRPPARAGGYPLGLAHRRSSGRSGPLFRGMVRPGRERG